MGNGIDKIRDSFYKEAEELWGFAKEEVIAILKEYTSKFNPDEISDYRLILQNRYLRREEIAKTGTPHVRKYSEELCPICGEKTIGEPSLFGKYTRTPGWSCFKGGYKHFLWWKVNKIRENQGLPPIDFLKIDWSKYQTHSQLIP